jgi:hypothetical protein
VKIQMPCSWLLILSGMMHASMLQIGGPAQDPSNTNQAQPSAASQPAQQKPAASVPEAPSKSKSDQEQQLEKHEQAQRALGVLPQFGVTNRQNAPPLSYVGKFHLFAKSAFDPVTIGITGLQAGLAQATNEFPGYGQGAQGYGTRFGASLADEVSAGFWSNFFYPVLLKADPRYFRLGQGSMKRRFLYGMKQEFVCHTDKGGRTFHFSNVLGAFTSGGISNAYYPEGDRGFGLTMSRSAIALAYGMAGGLFDEFYPDIDRKLFHRNQKSF